MYRSLLKAIKPPRGHWTKAREKGLTHKGFIFGVDGQSLIKMAHMFDRISFTIIDIKKGARYFKETLSHGIMPLASPWWSFRLLMIVFSSRNVTR